MRVFASTGPLFTGPLDRALAILAEAGFDGAELMVTQAAATQDPAAIVAAATREGIPVPVVHGPFLLLTRRVFGTEPIPKARRSLELAGAIGAELMIVHPPYRWQHGFHRWLRDAAEVEAAASDTRLGVENLYPMSVGGRAVRFHRYTLPEHLAAFPHIVLDTSHCGVAEVDINAAYASLRERLVHLHVSDHRGGPRDSHAPLGHGRLPLASFLHRAGQDTRAAADPDGLSITLELDCRPYLDDRAALVAFLRRELDKCRALVDGGSSEQVLERPDVVAVESGRAGLEA